MEFPESFFEVAVRELREETGLTAKHLTLKGLSGFTNPDGQERYVYYDFLYIEFEGEVMEHGAEKQVKWWPIQQLDQLEMQEDICNRLLLY